MILGETLSRGKPEQPGTTCRFIRTSPLGCQTPGPGGVWSPVSKIWWTGGGTGAIDLLVEDTKRPHV